MQVKVKVKIDLKPLEKYFHVLTSPGQKGFEQVMIKWIVRYKKYAMAQYNRNSSGGGAWPPLKEPIRKRVKKRSRLILRDSDTMRATLEPIPTLERYPKPGIGTKRLPRGVVIGFEGGGKHPYSKLSIAKLATVHHLGRGKVPVRTILVDPAETVKRGMVRDLKDVANSIKRNLGMK